MNDVRVPDDSKSRKEKREESGMGWWDERILMEQCYFKLMGNVIWNGKRWYDMIAFEMFMQENWTR